MSTVIVYNERAYVFEGQDVSEAVQSFLIDWVPEAITFQVMPLAGTEHGDSVEVPYSGKPTIELDHIRVFINTGATDRIEIATLLPPAFPPEVTQVRIAFQAAAQAGHGVAWAEQNLPKSLPIEVLDMSTGQKRMHRE